MKFLIGLISLAGVCVIAAGAGDEITLGVNVNRLHVFDKDTTRSLLWD